MHPRTLMAYERIGLLKPARRARRREYSADDVRWLRCLQEFNREGGISLVGLRTLLQFVPCWAVRSAVAAGPGGECHPASFPGDECLDRVREAYAGAARPECRDCGNYRNHAFPIGTPLENPHESSGRKVEREWQKP